MSAGIATEQHYTVRQVAELWNVSEKTVRRMFEDVEGVLKIQLPRILRKQAKRAPKTKLLIPESLLRRVHDDRSAGFAKVQARRGGV